MRTLLIAVLALSVAPSFALAGGGGGTKANGTIEVTNNGADDLAVILDASTADFADVDAFLDAGGRIVEAGTTARFTNVRVGNHRLSVAFIDDLGDPGAPTTRNNVNVTRGKTIRFRVNGSAAGGASIVLLQ
jgi:hypothetical protein